MAACGTEPGPLGPPPAGAAGRLGPRKPAGSTKPAAGFGNPPAFALPDHSAEGRPARERTARWTARRKRCRWRAPAVGLGSCGKLGRAAAPGTLLPLTGTLAALFRPVSRKRASTPSSRPPPRLMWCVAGPAALCFGVAGGKAKAAGAAPLLWYGFIPRGWGWFGCRCVGAVLPARLPLRKAARSAPREPLPHPAPLACARAAPRGSRTTISTRARLACHALCHVGRVALRPFLAAQRRTVPARPARKVPNGRQGGPCGCSLATWPFSRHVHGRLCGVGTFSPDGHACRQCRSGCETGTYAAEVCNGITNFECLTCRPEVDTL
jgi:hypothetical protein